MGAILHFNSRPHEEVDIIHGRSACSYIIFQLTTSRGGRRRSLDDGRSIHWYFNSRPHEEVDYKDSKISISDYIFQLTTSRGGRQDLKPRDEAVTPFQLTTSRGGRRTTISSSSFASAFQLTTSRGGRRAIAAKEKNLTDISTHDLTRRSTFPSGK